MTIPGLLVVPLVVAFGSCRASADGPPNHLSGGASSDYLKRAEAQPVNRYPWSAEAFAEARRRDVPVLLDVGAVWCPWCSLMDRESYTNAETAEYINANFVAAKVDFDQDPRLSAKLQRAQALLNLPAGLPLTAFVTPEAKLHYGGAYFPAEARGGKAAFRDVLREALQRFRHHRSEIERTGFDVVLSEEFNGQEIRSFYRSPGSAEILGR